MPPLCSMFKACSLCAHTWQCHTLHTSWLSSLSSNIIRGWGEPIFLIQLKTAVVGIPAFLLCSELSHCWLCPSPTHQVPPQLILGSSLRSHPKPEENTHKRHNSGQPLLFLHRFQLVCNGSITSHEKGFLSRMLDKKITFIFLILK